MGDRKLLLVAFLLVTSTVSWRGGTYYSGGVDPVVLLKAVLSVAGLFIAWRAAQTVRFQQDIGTRSCWIVGVYLTLSILGAVGAGTIVASGVLSVRLGILAAAVFFLLRAFAGVEVFRALVVAMATISVLAAVSGAPNLLGGGRLQGGIPPLAPNELAFLCATTAIALIWRGLQGQAGRFDLVAIVFFLAMVWLTGSRTGLVALIVAILVMMIQVRRWPLSAFLIVVAMVPVLIYAVFGLGLLSKYLARGGTANVGTLSNRTVAWSAATNLYHTLWQQAFGGGLSVKKIPVAGQWWNTQILDSSWVSALVQAGILGLAVFALWVVINLSSAALTLRPERLLWTGLLVYLVIRSVLESGLLDATPAFAVFFMISVLGESRSRRATKAAVHRPTPAQPTELALS